MIIYFFYLKAWNTNLHLNFIISLWREKQGQNLSKPRTTAPTFASVGKWVCNARGDGLTWLAPYTPQVKEELCNLEVGGGGAFFRFDNTTARHLPFYYHDAKYSLYSNS